MTGRFKPTRTSTAAQPWATNEVVKDPSDTETRTPYATATLRSAFALGAWRGRFAASALVPQRARQRPGAWRNANGQHEIDELFTALGNSFSDCPSEAGTWKVAHRHDDTVIE